VVSQSITKRSNNAVNRPPGSAQGNFTTRTPCWWHSLRGGLSLIAWGGDLRSLATGR
jgi:hypothetical protein